MRRKLTLRSAMTTEQSNSVIVLNVHKKHFDDATTAEELVAFNECCIDICGGGRPA